MKKKGYIIGVLICISCIFSSCRTNEEKVIVRLNKLSQKIEKNAVKWNTDDWSDALEEWEAIHDDMSTCQFTKEQIKELGRIDGELTAILIKQGLKEFASFFENIGPYMDGFTEGAKQQIKRQE